MQALFAPTASKCEQDLCHTPSRHRLEERSGAQFAALCRALRLPSAPAAQRAAKLAPSGTPSPHSLSLGGISPGRGQFVPTRQTDFAVGDLSLCASPGS